MLTHIKFIEDTLGRKIEKLGILKVGINLNEHFPFERANKYAEQYAKQLKSNSDQKPAQDEARQEKSSKDSILGKIVEEVIIYLLDAHFKANKFNYLITNSKAHNEEIKEIVSSLRIKRRSTGHEKQFDADILIYNQDTFTLSRKVFILSAKGTTRERIGQFLSHLFLMDQDVLDAKYGKDKYEVIFLRENISIRYAFVTLDWAENKDFTKYTKSQKLRQTVKNTEVQLILDDVKLGGGIYVLNNLDNMDGIGNFATLVGRICDYLK